MISVLLGNKKPAFLISESYYVGKERWKYPMKN